MLRSLYQQKRWILVPVGPLPLAATSRVRVGPSPRPGSRRTKIDISRLEVDQVRVVVAAACRFMLASSLDLNAKISLL